MHRLFDHLIILFFLLSINSFGQANVKLIFEKFNPEKITVYQTDNHLIPDYKEVDVSKSLSAQRTIYSLRIEKADHFKIAINEQAFSLHLQPNNEYHLVIDKNELIVHSTDQLNQLLKSGKEAHFKLYKHYTSITGKEKKSYDQAIENFLKEKQEQYKAMRLTTYAANTLKYSLLNIEAASINELADFHRLIKEKVLTQIDLTNHVFVQQVGTLYQNKMGTIKMIETATPIQPNPTLFFMDEIEFIPNDTLKQFIQLHQIKAILYGGYINLKPDREIIHRTMNAILDKPESATLYLMAQHLNNEMNTLKKGMELTELDLNIYGKDKIQLSELRGNIVVLDFWFAACKPCMQAIPETKELIKRSGDELTFIGVNPIDQEDTFLKVVKKKELEWPQIFTNKDDFILDKFNINSYPTYIIIDKEGKFYGRFDSREFKAALAALLKS